MKFYRIKNYESCKCFLLNLHENGYRWANGSSLIGNLPFSKSVLKKQDLILLVEEDKKVYYTNQYGLSYCYPNEKINLEEFPSPIKFSKTYYVAYECDLHRSYHSMNPLTVLFIASSEDELVEKSYYFLRSSEYDYSEYYSKDEFELLLKEKCNYLGIVEHQVFPYFHVEEFDA